VRRCGLRMDRAIRVDAEVDRMVVRIRRQPVAYPRGRDCFQKSAYETMTVDLPYEGPEVAEFHRRERAMFKEI
jgi:hypothetical protein